MTLTWTRAADGSYSAPGDRQWSYLLACIAGMTWIAFVVDKDGTQHRIPHQFSGRIMDGQRSAQAHEDGERVRP
jgi:hypothetical protein